MKAIITLTLLLFTSLGFAQHTGMIVGTILDKEFAENPLVLADVQVKGTAIKANTDQTGLFIIEHLEDGDYTLVCSFAGYETKEIKVKVSANTPSNLKLSMEASRISLADLASLTSTAQKEGDQKTVATELK